MGMVMIPVSSGPSPCGSVERHSYERPPSTVPHHVAPRNSQRHSPPSGGRAGSVAHKTNPGEKPLGFLGPKKLTASFAPENLDGCFRK